MESKEKTLVRREDAKTGKYGYVDTWEKEFFPFSYSWVRDLKEQ